MKQEGWLDSRWVMAQWFAWAMGGSPAMDTCDARRLGHSMVAGMQGRLESVHESKRETNQEQGSQESKSQDSKRAREPEKLL